MFGIPEIDIMILTRISRHDLVQCLRVSKQWHRISIPYIWNDISSIPHYRKGAFRRIVLEDYLHEQQQQDTQHPITNNLPTTLQKYSHWIQKLPSPGVLYNYFESSREDYESNFDVDYEALMEARKRITAESENPTVTPIELVRHLLRRCLDVEVDYVNLDAEIFNSPDLSAIASEYFLPLAQNVIVGQSHSAGYWAASILMEARRAKSFLCRCSHKLRKLNIGYISPMEDSESDHAEGNNEKEDIEEEESTLGLRPTELILAEYSEESKRKEFWSWLWKRCGSLELLDLEVANHEIQNLAEGVRNHMPSLQKIRLGMYLEDWGYINDRYAATLLSSCHKGWKSVEIRFGVGFHEASKSALVKSYPTLESFTAPFIHFESSDLIHLLRSAPNLRALNTTCDGWYSFVTPIKMDSESFVDMDPHTGSLKMWACEGSLKELRVRLTNTPQPELGKREGAIEETYPGQGRDIQHRVYDRLARLTKLEKLWLGHYAKNSVDDMFESSAYQVGCLEMSLESGLDRLKGLKELEELSLAYMNTKIGMDEIRWMAENWPKLRVIRGLDGTCDKYEHKGRGLGDETRSSNECCCDIDRIKEWLKEHYPRLRIMNSQETLHYDTLIPH